MIRPLSRPHTATNLDISVCSICWTDNPCQARLLPPNIQTDDRFDVPLRHAAAHLTCVWTPARTEVDKQGVQTKIKTAHISSDDKVSKVETSETRVPAGRGCPLIARKSGIDSRADICASCEDRAEFVYTPDPPAVSPCSVESCSSSDDASGSNSREEEDLCLLLSEVTSRLPCIECGQSVMMAWTDVREVFFPRCSAPFCNIVINALKLQLKYPHIPQFMHACSQSEQVDFLKRHLHLVTVGTLLVDVETFLKHRNSLLVMVETKHLVTADARSVDCVYAQQPRSHQDDWKQRETADQKQRSNDHLLPVVVTPSNTELRPGDASTPQEAMVPLSLLPQLFPRYRRQLLLMATGFISGKDKRATRKCCPNEARLLNMWHWDMKGSNNQLVTSGDLLVKWADVVLIVDPLAKHAARVCTTPQHKQLHRQQQQQSRHQETQIRNNETPPPPLRGQSLIKQNTTNQETLNGSNAKISAETWMPQILNFYSTAVTPDTSAALELVTESIHWNVKQKLGEHEESGCQEKVGSNSTKSQERNKEKTTIGQTDNLQSGWTNKGDDTSLTTQADDVPLFQTETNSSESDDSPSISSCDSYCDIAPIAVKVTRRTCTVAVGKNTVQKDSCKEEKRRLQPTVKPIRILSEERFESSPEQQQVSPPKRFSRPRKCKESKSVARRSERIANQTKEPRKTTPNEYDEEKAVVTLQSLETPSAKNRHQTKKPEKNDKVPDSIPSTSADSDQSSTDCAEGMSGGIVCVAESKNDKAISGEMDPCHGFRNIADLFLVLSNEEVSHRSKQLAKDEMCEISKTRALGDLSSKGLDFCTQSQLPLPVQKPQACCSTKVSHQDNHPNNVPQTIGKNRNKYPFMLLEAQKCPVKTPKDVPDKQECNKSQEQVSVTNIMKSMDDTFNAFKPDPIELVKAKMRAPKNPTGYVNTDYIQITNHRENGDLSPLNKHKSDPVMKRNVKFTTADISAILKSQNQKQKYSILEPKSSSPQQTEMTRKTTSSCIDSTVNETEKASPIRATRSSSHSPPSKPHWNVKKVIKTQAAPKPLSKQDINNGRKARMEADFHAMKTKALAISETQPIRNECAKPSVKKTNVNQEKKKDGKPSSKGKSDSVLTTKGHPKPGPSEKSAEATVCAEGDRGRTTSNIHHVQPVSGTSKGVTDKTTSHIHHVQPISGTSEGAFTSNKVGTVPENVLQSKKRQRLEDATEGIAHHSTQNQPSTSHMTAYWSGFPVGQSKDSLTNCRYGKSRYPIDYYTSAPIPNRRSKRNIKGNVSTDSSPDATTACMNTGSDMLPSCLNWDRRLYLPFTCVSLPAGTGIAQELMTSNAQQSYLNTEARERLPHSRSLSADHHHFVIQNNEKPLPTELGVLSSSRDPRNRGNYSSDTSCDGDNAIPQHTCVSSFYKPFDGYEDVTSQVEEHEIPRLAANESKITPHVAITNSNSTSNRGLLAVTGEIPCAQRANGTQDWGSDSVGKIPAPPVVANGPFHEIARLKAGGNSHSIRHLTGLFRQTIGKCIRKMDSKDTDPLELPNGECMILNEKEKIWYMDKSNNNFYTIDMLEQSGSIQSAANMDKVNQISPGVQEHFHVSDSQEPSIINESSCADLSDIEDLFASTVSSFQILHTCLLTTDRQGNTNNNCKDDLLEIKPSKGDINLTNKIDSPSSEIKSVNTDFSEYRPSVNTDFVQPIYPSYGAMVKDEPIRKNILLRETLKNSFFLIQEISKCVCTCKDVVMSSKPGEKMPYKNFLKQQYLESVSNCPLHSEHKYARQRQEMISIFEHLSRFRKQTECPVDKDKVKRKGNLKKKGRDKSKDQKDNPRPGCSWFSEREYCEGQSRSMKDQCLMSAAKDYLAAYVNQHYKKELFWRHQIEDVAVTEGDHLFTNFFTFIEKLQHKANKEKACGTPMPDTRTGNLNSSSVTDRQLKRQLQGKGSAVMQQRIFMQILKKSQTEQISSKLRTDKLMASGSSVKEIHNGSQEEPCVGRNLMYDQLGSAVCVADNYLGPQEEKSNFEMGSLNNASYDEVLSKEHPDVSYHGMVYFNGQALPYVVDNGYKYLTVRQAATLLPKCCCSIARSLLKRHSSLNRTLCTWDQVGMLDSLRAKKDRTIVRTGDILIRLDTLIISLPALDVELEIRHRQQRRKNSAACLYHIESSS